MKNEDKKEKMFPGEIFICTTGCRTSGRDGQFQEKNLLNSENVQVEVLADIPETAPAEIPEEVRVFLDAVQSLKALGGLTEENAEEFNARGQAAMDAYEVVQNANLEDYEGVEEALAALIEAGNSMTGGVEEAAAGKMCNGSSTLYVGQITVDKNNKYGQRKQPSPVIIGTLIRITLLTGFHIQP